LIITGEQFRAARAMARIEQTDLARQAKVSVETIKRLERTEGPVSAKMPLCARWRLLASNSPTEISLA
jgi:DNA-binding XRE family transcriptional regulator